MSKTETAGVRTSTGRYASRTRASLATCAALLAIGTVFGHAKLLESSPAAGAEITGSPPALTLTFNEDVRLGVLKLTTAGQAVPVVIDPNPPAARVVTIKLPSLRAGAYEVQWSALTPSDGHVVKGRYTFVIR